MMKSIHSRAAIRPLLLMIAVLPLSAASLAAQQYTYLPSASTTDGRFLALTGGSIQTLGENPLVFKLASPCTAAAIEIGIFDGDTQGIFDQGTVPLIYTLYADPEGDATGTVQVGEWQGDIMPNNAWYPIILSNSEAARCTTGDYFYTLKVRSSTVATVHWSCFKLRTTGSIAIARASNVTFSVPLASLADATSVYPSYPALTPTNYNGVWRFNMDVPTAVGSLVLWDGDFDRGSYDCSDNDTDDEDTPNTRPAFATGSAVAEGKAASTVACQDAAGNVTTGTTTSNPPDDSRSPVFARATGVSYEITAPDGVRYANGNPSGNLEWEQFRLSTGTFNRSTMDYHANALPAGTYAITINGMDLANLNAMRFPYDITGVDINGNAVTPIRPDYTNGSIGGTVYFEAGNNCTQGLLELGIPLAAVRLNADYNGDGIIDATWVAITDLLGNFNFNGLHPGSYTVTVDRATLALGINEVCDSDGSATLNSFSTRLTMCSRSIRCVFGYRLGDLLSESR